MERLDKVLAGTGRWSRREVKLLVRQGLVRLNGAAAGSAEEKCDPETAVITVNGETVVLRRFTYVLLHKPGGVLTATEDRRQETVMELLPQELRRVGLAPVGRLDKDTEGLLLLTNDGELTHRLLSPKYHVDKRYFARVDGHLTAAYAEAFAKGMTLGDGLKCLPARLEILPDSGCIVTVREGKFHQVKRMLASCGAPVVYLKRLSMGPLVLGDELGRGEHRMLREEEVAALYRTCGL
jgi:pseudouridylate synthase